MFSFFHNQNTFHATINTNIKSVWTIQTPDFTRSNLEAYSYAKPLNQKSEFKSE